MNSNEIFERDFTRAQAAMILGVHSDTIMYWEENNLIPQPRRNARNNYRVYSIDEIMEIAQIRGISVVDIDAVDRDKERKRLERQRNKIEQMINK